jgi:hypothetical protein
MRLKNDFLYRYNLQMAGCNRVKELPNWPALGATIDLHPFSCTFNLIVNAFSNRAKLVNKGANILKPG